MKEQNIPTIPERMQDLEYKIDAKVTKSDVVNLISNKLIQELQDEIKKTSLLIDNIRTEIKNQTEYHRQDFIDILIENDYISKKDIENYSDETIAEHTGTLSMRYRTPEFSQTKKLNKNTTIQIYKPESIVDITIRKSSDLLNLQKRLQELYNKKEKIQQHIYSLGNKKYVQAELDSLLISRSSDGKKFIDAVSNLTQEIRKTILKDIKLIENK